MAAMSYFHFDGEIEGFHVEGDCECEYITDNDGEDIPRRKTMAFYDIVLTNTTTGESEFVGEDVPDELTNLVRDLAEDEFIVA